MNEITQLYEEMPIKENILNYDVLQILNSMGSYDNQLKKHCKNVGNLAYKICLSMNLDKDFTNYCTACGYIHDIGKTRIPKEIFDKKGKNLTKEEYDIYINYLSIGYNFCIKNLGLQSYSYFMKTYSEDITNPNPENVIPLETKIVKIANTFDNLRRKHNCNDYIRYF